jgi:hypothetical protein
MKEAGERIREPEERNSVGPGGSELLAGDLKGGRAHENKVAGANVLTSMGQVGC